ncbi:MAG: hypothetical protein DRJ03_19880 [Chloroflexi bacterium]|nr:MAG: hypothetical protein DRJ03_19880 [Chloroflexota bacterium]
MRTKLVLLAGAMILTLVVGPVGTAAAQSDGPGGSAAPARRGARVYGLIETIENGPLTLATPIGSVALVTDANTRFRIPDTEGGSLDDLAIGDTVAASGWWEEEGGTFHAFGVARLEPNRPFPLAGKLDSIGDDTLMVETEHGPATVHVDGETAYRVSDVEDPGLDDLVEGMKIVLKGTLNPDGSLLAQMIASPRVGPRQGRLQGEVTAVEGDTFTLRAGRGREFSVLTDEATEFRVSGVDNPSIADLHVGDHVAGEGEADADGVVRATLVIVLPEQVARLNGEAFAINGTTLVLDTLGGKVNILTDGDTIFRTPGVEEATLDDVEIGERVTAVGAWESDMTFRAVAVGVVGGRRAGQQGNARGRVISVGSRDVVATSIVLGTPQGPVTALVDAETQYRVPDVETPSLDDITVGDSVGARGAWNEDGTLQATGVAVLEGKPRGGPRDRGGHKRP